MPTKLNIPLPIKGLTVDRPGEFVDSRAATAISNMEVNRSVLRKRCGTSALGATLGERVMRMFELRVGPATRLFRIGLTKVEVYDKGTNTWGSVTATALTGTAADMFDYTFPILLGDKIAVYTNGIDAIRKCSVTGNDAALGGTPPLAKFVQAFGPYLVLANVVDTGEDYYSRVQWCDTGDPENWSTGNAGIADLLEDSEEITGLGVFGNFLTIHKPNSIYVGQLVTTANVFRFDRKATGVGAVSGATIQNIPSGEQIFLASDGIHLFNGITAPLIDSPIQDELREEMNPEFLNRAQSVFVEELDEYWVSVPIGSSEEPDTVYKYNWRTQQIFKDTRANLTAMTTYINTADLTWDDLASAWDSSSDRWNSNSLATLNPVVAFGDSSGVTTRRNTSLSNDVAAAISGNWDTKDFTATDFGLPDMDVMMRWMGLEVWAKGAAMSVYYSLDGGTSWTLAKTLTLDSDYPDDDAPINVYFDVVKSRIRFRFENATAGETFTLLKYQIEAVKREARK